MIYIFEILNSDYIKIGYTSKSNVYFRIEYGGFYTNKHPVELCHKLGPDDLNLLYVFLGDIEIEKNIKFLFPNENEFYPNYMCAIFVNILRFVTQEEELPPRPRPSFFRPCVEKVSCCGGEVFRCKICQKIFLREHKLREHIREVHNNANRVTCSCGKIVLKRNMKRHKISAEHISNS